MKNSFPFLFEKFMNIECCGQNWNIWTDLLIAKDKAVNSIFKNPESVFVKVRAMDMMFDGLPIDCTVTDFAGGAVCSMLKENADDLQKDGEDRYRFSFLGAVSLTTLVGYYDASVTHFGNWWYVDNQLLMTQSI